MLPVMLLLQQVSTNVDLRARTEHLHLQLPGILHEGRAERTLLTLLHREKIRDHAPLESDMQGNPGSALWQLRSSQQNEPIPTCTLHACGLLDMNLHVSLGKEVRNCL